MNAIIFPGQGAQYSGMGKSFYDNDSDVKKLFSNIDDILGFKLSEKCFLGSAEELKDTSLQQLAILSVSLAAYEVFKKTNVDFKYFSGLSLGEYSCLYPSGVLSLEDVVKLVQERGLAMQQAAKNSPSTMCAVIGLDKDTLLSLQDQGFYLANINSPSQIAISLAPENKEKVISLLSEKGAKRVIPLDVSGGFHSPFMNDAKLRLSKMIETLQFNDAKIPIVSNYTAKAHTNADEIKDNLVNQLTNVVLWKAGVEFMHSHGVVNFFELGPSKVLKGLMRKINSDLVVKNIEKIEDLEVLANA